MRFRTRHTRKQLFTFNNVRDVYIFLRNSSKVQINRRLYNSKQHINLQYIRPFSGGRPRRILRFTSTTRECFKKVGLKFMMSMLNVYLFSSSRTFLRMKIAKSQYLCFIVVYYVSIYPEFWLASHS